MHPRSLSSISRLCRLSRRTSPKPWLPFSTRTLTNFSNKTHHRQRSSKSNHFYNYPCSSSATIPPTHFSISQHSRKYSAETDREVDKINTKFAEAREEIESAMESKETVYFNEEAECARAAVGEVLQMYEGLLNKLPDTERAAIQRAMGLKIEQLKAELQQLND